MKLHDLNFMSKPMCTEVHAPWPANAREHPNCTRWQMWDVQSSEVEVIEFLYSLVRLIKPSVIVETGPYIGYSTTAMAAAQQENGFGELVTIEMAQHACDNTLRTLTENKLTANVKIINGDSLSILPTLDTKIDLLFSDSHIPIRGQEILLCQSKMTNEGIIAVHDTSPNHKHARKDLDELSRQGVIDRIHFSSPRGFSLAKLRI